MNEKQIQNYIWEKRESFADLLVTPQFPKELSFGIICLFYFAAL